MCLWMSTFEPSVGSFPSCRFSYGFLSFFYNSSGPAIIFDEFFEARVVWRFEVSVKEFHLGFCFGGAVIFFMIERNKFVSGNRSDPLNVSY